MRVDKSKETVEVLSTAPIKDRVLHAPVVIGATPGATNDLGDFDNSISKEDAVQMATLAPVIADATTVGRQELPKDEAPPKPRIYRVMKDKTLQDAHGSGRITMHEGKEISSAHHDIRKLQKQGLRLKDITDLDEDEAAPTDY